MVYYSIQTSLFLICVELLTEKIRRAGTELDENTRRDVLPPHHPPLEASSIKKVRLNVMLFRKRKEKKSFGRNEQVGGQTCLYNQWMTHGHPQWRCVVGTYAGQIHFLVPQHQQKKLTHDMNRE